MSYYISIFSKVDVFHFNSNLAMNVYGKFISIKNGKCISITNSRVKNNCLSAHKDHFPLRVGYIGPYKEHKGFYEFLQLTYKLNSPNIEYHIFGSNEKIDLPPNVINHGKFDNTEFAEVYRQLDVVIIPSLWKETFGFVTIEALSFGVKVLVSKYVGSKDLVPNGFVFSSIDKIPELLKNLSQYPTKKTKTMHEHCLEIEELYLGG